MYVCILLFQGTKRNAHEDFNIRSSSKPNEGEKPENAHQSVPTILVGRPFRMPRRLRAIQLWFSQSTKLLRADREHTPIQATVSTLIYTSE